MRYNMYFSSFDGLMTYMYKFNKTGLFWCYGSVIITGAFSALA